MVIGCWFSCHAGDSSAVSLALENAKVIPTFSREETDNTDDTDDIGDTDDTGDTNDTDNTDNTDDTDDTK